MPFNVLSDEHYRGVLALYVQAYRAGCIPIGSGIRVHAGKTSCTTHVARALGISNSAAYRRIQTAITKFGDPLQQEIAALERPRVRVQAKSDAQVSPDRVADALRKRGATVEQLAEQIQATPQAVRTAIEALRAHGMRLVEQGGQWSLDRSPPPAAWQSGPLQSFLLDANNQIVFGACGDAHLGSKYERAEVLHDLYDRFAEEGCAAVFNTGNWIDGEARFNKHDIHKHGMQQQLDYLAHAYPQRPGITTYAVAGDDHEGWYDQREGVNIGQYAEHVMRQAGRTDWVNLGYMEAPVRLVSPETGKEAIMAVVHPGGGSSYALSYAIQKIIESLDGGEKPAIGLYGHYHKLWAGNIRNVWCVQTGTTCDQTPFMRKRKLEAHVGGWICRATMDPATGAIIRFRTECFRYFNAGYAAGRWSSAKPVNMLHRALNGVQAGEA